VPDLTSETHVERGSEYLVLHFTGLPSRSALVAPPFRLAALRWREANVIFGRLRPPPDVSTACLVAVTQFSGRPFPGEPHTALCPSELGRWRHNAVYGTPADARRLVLSCVSTTRTERAPKPQPSWWRGLPARAKTTCLRSSGPTTGKMPVAPWAGAHGSGASRFAGCVSIAGMSLLLQRRLAPPRALRSTSGRTSDRGSGRDRIRDSGSEQVRAPTRSRIPATATAPGHGPSRCGVLNTPNQPIAPRTSPCPPRPTGAPGYQTVRESNHGPAGPGAHLTQ
jgi:hypothetical protein